MRKLLLLLLLPALSQAQHIEIKETYPTDGSTSVYGINNSFIPYTITLEAVGTEERSTPALPLYLVLFPSKHPQLLTTFAANRHRIGGPPYLYSGQVGLISSTLPDTSYRYPLPVRATQLTEPPRCACDTVAYPQDRYLYVFTVAAGGEEPVRAVRAGIVGAVVSRGPAKRLINRNFVMVLHDDGTYASYENVSPRSAVVAEGQRVAAGDVLASFVGGRRGQFLWFSVQRPSLAGPVALPVVFEQDGRPLRPR